MTTETIANDEIRKASALAKHLECDLEEAATAIDAGDWLVLTDDESDEAARENILESVWAFNWDFLTGHSKAISNIPKEDFTAMQDKLCEGFNDAVLAMIDDVDHFVSDAIRADGRGHFLSHYDGEEVELDGGLFAYRCN